MIPYKYISLFVLLAAVSSCSFNMLYLVPDKLEDDTKELDLVHFNSRESLSVRLGENYQPEFFVSDSVIYNSGYSIKSILFPSGKDKKLNGWLISPDSTFNGTTLIFMHGNAGNLYSQYQLVEPFVNRGYKVFIFDYSGFGFSQGRATRKNVLIDAKSSIDYLLSREDLKTDHLLIYGQSLGGHLAAAIAYLYEDDIDGLIIEGAFSSHKDIAAETAGFLGRIFVAEMYSGKVAIKKFTKPVLIIHSNEDRAIPFKMGQVLYENANEPKSFFEITESHILGPLYFADEISKKITEILDNHIESTGQ